MMNNTRQTIGFTLTATFTVVALIATSASTNAGTKDSKKKPNVLFIAIDDLRPQLGCYGHKYMNTPNLDKLAANSRLFRRHFVQVPTCGASRFALLTGLRPSATGAMNNGAFARLSRKPTKDPQTMPEAFRRAGYETVCIGKISHQPGGKVYSYQGKGDGRTEVPFAWSALKTPHGKWKYSWGAYFGYANGIGRTFHPHPTPTENADVGDDGYADGLLANAAIQELRRLSKSDKSFFIGLGFYKPHLPFNAPKKYWDLYDRSKLPLSPNPKKPGNISSQSWHSSGEMFGRYRHPNGRKVDEAHARLLRHGYFACVSYVDALVGRVLAELRKLGLDENTIIVVWGDHGWHLGDHAIWGKHSNFERALHSAFIVHVPNMKNPGAPTDGLAETLDIYPTLLDLCQVPAPKKLAGASLRPILDDPNHPGKDAAFGYWRGGRTMRTDRWRITHYPAAKKRKEFVELYDHNTDPNETTNVASKHTDVVERLLPMLKKDAPSMQGGR